MLAQVLVVANFLKLNKLKTQCTVGDQLLISPDNVNTLSSREVMRIKKYKSTINGKLFVTVTGRNIGDIDEQM